MDIRDVERASPAHWLYDISDQLKQFVYRRSEEAFAAGDAARDAITTREALEARQRETREQFLASLGGLPPSDTPLEARTVGVVEGNGFCVERVIFQSRPRHYVTANLYIPDALDGPRGAVLFVCGHHARAKHEPEYQIVCQYLVQAGLIVLAQDPIGQGERFSYYDRDLGTVTIGECCPEHDYAGAQCLPVGDSLARYFLHDSMRSVDYLCSRPEVDPNRIGITGNSGGGTQSCLMMLADPRLAAAAPGTFIMNRETYMHTGGAQDAEQIWPGFTARGRDHEDVLLALTPKPVRVLAVTSDFFPIEGTRRTVERCRRLWGLYGREDCVDLVEDDSEHHYTPHLAREAARFFARHLLGTEPTFDEFHIAPFEPSRLWCTPGGQVRAAFPDAESAHEANRARLVEVEAQRRSASAAERGDQARRWLHAKTHRDRRPTALNPRFFGEGHVEELRVRMAIWWSQERLFNHGVVFRDPGRDGETLPVTLAVWDGGTNVLRPHWPWIRQTCAAGRAVLVLDVSGSGALLPRPLNATPPEAFYGVLHKLSDDLIWLDDDLVSLRTYDVLRALEMVALWPGLDAGDIAVYAHGRQGLYGRLAAAIEPRIGHIEVDGGQESLADWITPRYYDSHNIYAIIQPGALQHYDLPELEGSA